jgi:hypothetical protein
MSNKPLTRRFGSLAFILLVSFAVAIVAVPVWIIYQLR